MNEGNLYTLNKNVLVNKIYECRGCTIDMYDYLYNIPIQILRIQNDRRHNSEFFSIKGLTYDVSCCHARFPGAISFCRVIFGGKMKC